MERIKENLQDDNGIVVLKKRQYLQKLSSSEGKEQIIYVKSNIIKVFKSLYFLYEFSDNICFISKEINNYPTLFNFTKTGILTEKEVYDALLYQNK